jgi:hypothetical protein
MRKTRRTKITVETERLLVISRTRGAVESWCESCGAAARLVGLDEASALSGHDQRQLVHQVEDGSLHFIESPRGRLLICLNSLLGESRSNES